MKILNLYYLLIIFCLTACGSGSPSEQHSKGIAGSSCEYNQNQQTTDSIQWNKLLNINATYLSEYQLFTDSSDPTQKPLYPGVAYQLNSSLFTDHARKYRFIFIPPGCAIDFRSPGIFDFPIGSVLVKNFSMPSHTDLSGTNNETLIEVRLLIKRHVGWIALTYVWDETLQDAKHLIFGDTLEITVTHNNVAEIANYSIPSTSECLICHENDQGTTPIGQKARHLNRSIFYEGQNVNQLTLWSNLGLIQNLPAQLEDVEKIPNWKDNTEPLNDRAKAYLDINCAHCHNDEGTGSISGLRLEYWRPLNRDHGICKTSQGWRGGYFDIWPGDSRISGIPIRMRHTEAKDRMPPIGRSLVDEEAAQLISDWIDAMPYKVCSGQ